MSFPVFLDTCAIFGQGLADLLLTLAERSTYRPLWSAGVLNELQKNLCLRGIAAAAVDFRIESMQSAFPDAEVQGYEPIPVIVRSVSDENT
ncbi:MAG: PIN domain-containing protein [Propionibacteriaceae bacterium]|nr:PIN domain-containing protein [Propionibacteriaceae bacterium]